MCICFAKYLSKHFIALTVTTRGERGPQRPCNERWGCILFYCSLTLLYMLPLCMHTLAGSTGLPWVATLKLHPWEQANWKGVETRRGQTWSSDMALSCTVNLSLPTPVHLIHWCHFSDKVHSLNSSEITLFLILHRWWSPPSDSSVLASQTWHQRETCSGFRLTISTIPGSTSWLCRSLGAAPCTLYCHTTLPSPVWCQISHANQSSIFLNCSRKFRKHKFLKLTAGAFT